MTNNPNKLEAIRKLGIQIEERLPLLVEPNRYSAGYLDVKRRQMQHELPSSVGNASPPEQSDRLALEARKASGD
jgi:GTP cyclohydrolase II